MRKPRKRANGEGTIYELGNGRYKASITVGHKPDGTPIRKSANGKTKKEALARAREKMIEYSKRGPVVSGSETTGHYLDRWLEGGRVKGRVQPATLKSYSHAVVCMKPLIGHIKLEDLRPAHIQAAYDDLAKRYAPSTMKTMSGILHHAFEGAVEWELMPKNPAKYAETPKEEKIERNVLSPKQARLLIEKTEEVQYKALWTVLATCGLRISEALGLTWDDYDGSYLHVRKGKTAAATRPIPLIPETVDALERRRSDQKAQKMENRDIWTDTNYIFTTRTGGAIDPRWAWEKFKRDLKHAGLPDMRLHDLRRTAVAWLREAGVDVDVVQVILGHEDIGTTINIYGTVNRGRLEDAREKLDAYLRKAQ